jgi:NADH-quinone oxidoreductase subunit C
MSQAALDRLQAVFGGAIVETHSLLGDDTALVNPARWREIASFCRTDADLAFDMLVDLTAVDYPDREQRLELVMHVRSVRLGHRLRLKARLGEAEMTQSTLPEIESVCSVWVGANWFEREVYDMFGIRFVGHPDMRRILMYPEFEGYPLRKDYPAQKTQPLVAYRTEEEAGLPLEKQKPFGSDEGMSFPRKDWIRVTDDGAAVLAVNPLDDAVTEFQQRDEGARAALPLPRVHDATKQTAADHVAKPVELPAQKSVS